MIQVFFDFETTGVTSADAPIQVAGLICEEFGPILDTFNERIKTTRSINAAASAVHGITAADLADCRSERAVMADFISWVIGNGAQQVVGHNIKAFDLKMMSRRCEVLHLTNPFADMDAYDTRTLVTDAKKKDLFGLSALGRKWSLPATAEIMGISHENAHDALGDIITNKLIYDKLKRLL